jgi:hypothetical protein
LTIGAAEWFEYDLVTSIRALGAEAGIDCPFPSWPAPAILWSKW